MRPKTHHPSRKTLLAQVHIAKKDLGLEDDAYRGMLTELFGVESAGKLKAPQLHELIEHFKVLGWQAKPRRRQHPVTGRGEFIEIPDSDPHAPQKRLILALARGLGWDLEAFNKRLHVQFGVDRIEWLKDPDALQTLSKDLTNRAKKAGIYHR